MGTEDAGWIWAYVPVGPPGQLPKLLGKWRGHTSPKDLESVDNLLNLDYLCWLSLPPQLNPSHVT